MRYSEPEVVQQDGFILFEDAGEMRKWLHELEIWRGIDRLLIHHTWQPNYKSFNGSNHFALQKGMQRFHMRDRGWIDIGQHFSTFPDGTVMTGRSLEFDPACTRGANLGAICIENVGNFDEDGDVMADAHRECILETSAYICERWGIPINAEHILYHHWFDLNTGRRTDGTGVTKSCPGTGFFGGNSVEAADAFFMPLVKLKLES